MMVNLLLLAASLGCLWGTWRLRKRLDEARELARSQQSRLDYMESVLAALGLQPPPPSLKGPDDVS